MLFGKKNGGGIADVIRCDEAEYLVWKWVPIGTFGDSDRANAIRWGSSLRVKDGELAVFFYKQDSGDRMHDFIVGPYDETLKTANFPILSSVLGSAFDGVSPFQAEVYFINLALNNQIRFGVRYFDVFDPRFLDFAVPVSATGTMTFNITDYRSFIKMNRLIQFDKNDFYSQISDAVSKSVKGVIANCPSDSGIPVLQIERKILDINELIRPHIDAICADYGVNCKRFDLSTIEIDKSSEGYAELRNVTASQQARSIEASTEINIRNLDEVQQLNTLDMAEKLRIQRKGAELQAETHHLDVHRLNLQAGVLQTAAQNLGGMGDMGNSGGGSENNGLNPAGLMMGMALGGAMGGQMAGMVNQMGQNMQQSSSSMPPPPLQSLYSISVNGQTQGPFSIEQMRLFAHQGAVSADTFVWKQGMAEWQAAGSVAELQAIFGAMPPAPPSAI